jgi:putative intracellular protease/amidase
MTAGKGKIGVLIEAHFDDTEFQRFGEFFPERGYGLDYLTHLWGQPQLTFEGNENRAEVTVSLELNEAEPGDYRGIILIGGYAMDRLRYQEHPRAGQANQAPAVRFLRKAIGEMDRGRLKVGTICHGLWLFCADPGLLRGRKVTCAHNILCDVENAGGIPVFEGDQLQDVCVDGSLVTARHPGVVDSFLETFVKEIERASGAAH